MRTSHGHGHCPKESMGIVHVKAVVLKKQVHVHIAEIVRCIPQMEGAITHMNAAPKGGQAPCGLVIAVQLEPAIHPACTCITWYEHRRMEIQSEDSLCPQGSGRSSGAVIHLHSQA